MKMHIVEQKHTSRFLPRHQNVLTK